MVNNNINQYCEQQSEQENKLQKEIREYTYANETYPQMISGILVGNFLYHLIKINQSKRILEIGMFTGYSAASMAKALPENGTIDTCEYMEEHIKTAKKLFKNSQYSKMITMHQGPALETLEKFKNKFDFIFIDADKINYLNYYLKCMQLIKSGGIIVLDNMLWSGEVLNPKDKQSKTLRKTGDYIQTDERVLNFLVPIRDGLMICIKK
tara:strand:+ start:2153 stop:2779 length:627 start_codon:yes stop_codon:yes gene_type:complete